MIKGAFEYILRAKEDNNNEDCLKFIMQDEEDNEDDYSENED